MFKQVWNSSSIYIVCNIFNYIGSIITNNGNFKAEVQIYQVHQI